MNAKQVNCINMCVNVIFLLTMRYNEYEDIKNMRNKLKRCSVHSLPFVMTHESEVTYAKIL